jgi:hypothetical protein
MKSLKKIRRQERKNASNIPARRSLKVLKYITGKSMILIGISGSLGFYFAKRTPRHRATPDPS